MILTRHDTGYINFFPPKPGQESEELTENVLKHGLLLKPVVSAETFISRSKQIESVKDESIMHDLEDFAERIFHGRAADTSKIQ